MSAVTSSSPIRMRFPLPAARSDRTRTIARWFGLDASTAPTDHSKAIDPARLAGLLPGPGHILLITGPSGSGKSSLLRAIQSSIAPECWTDLNEIELPHDPVIDCFGRLSLKQALGLLSRVGLAEAWTYLRTPDELSEGQRWRLRLALALMPTSGTGNSNIEIRNPKQIRMKEKEKCSKQCGDGSGFDHSDFEICACFGFRNSDFVLPAQRVLVCDEFAAVLDRVTAAVVARSLRRAVSASGISAILATSHDDLVGALRPDLHVHCDFGSIRADSTSTG